MDFSSEEEVKKALQCNREYMGKGARRRLQAGGLPAYSQLLHKFAVCLLCAGHCSRRKPEPLPSWRK